MSNQITNTVGLILDITGDLLLFKYGLPQPTFEKGVELALEDGNTVAKHNVLTGTLKENSMSLFRFGRSLIILGFALQLIAAWF